MTVVMNPAGYNAPKAVKHADLSPESITGDGQLIYGRPPAPDSVWVAPSYQSTPIEKVFVSVDYGYAWQTRSRRRIPVRIPGNGLGGSGGLAGVTVEIDGVRFEFADNTFNSVSGYEYVFQHPVTEAGSEKFTLRLNFKSRYWYSGTPEPKYENYLDEIEFLSPETAIPAHVEILEIRHASGEPILPFSNEQDSLCVGKMFGSDRLEKLNTVSTVRIDDPKSLEDYKTKNYAPETRILFLERSARYPLSRKEISNSPGYVYPNSAFSDEAMKTIGNGRFRVFWKDLRGVRHVGSTYGQINVHSNDWETGYNESIDGKLVSARFVKENGGQGDFLFLTALLGEGETIGVYSLTIGDRVVSDDPTRILGSAVSLGDNTVVPETGIYKSRAAADRFRSLGLFEDLTAYAEEDGTLWVSRGAGWVRVPDRAEYDALAARVAALEAK